VCYASKIVELERLTCLRKFEIEKLCSKQTRCKYQNSIYFADSARPFPSQQYTSQNQYCLVVPNVRVTLNTTMSIGKASVWTDTPVTIQADHKVMSTLIIYNESETPTSIQTCP